MEWLREGVNLICCPSSDQGGGCLPVRNSCACSSGADAGGALPCAARLTVGICRLAAGDTHVGMTHMTRAEHGTVISRS